jgi:O-glycosyl hydrolase
MYPNSKFVFVSTPSVLLKLKGVLLLLLAAWLLAFPMNSRGDYTASVSPGTVVVNNFQGWGASLCWWANVVGSYSNRDTYADLAFSQLKLNIVRYNIGGGENPTNNFLSYRARMPGFEPTNGVWNWNADLNQRWMLQAALARGANLVDAFANSPPWWMTVSGSVTGAVGATNNLQVADETLFATYLATVVSNLTVLDGVHFDYVTPMNEPVGTKWTYGNTQEGCDMSATQQIPVINALRTALNTSLPAAGIDASEDVDPYQSVSSIDTYPAATLNNLALCTTHTYSETGNTSFATKANQIGKPMWVSEYGDSDGTGLTMAQRIHDDITGMGVQAWCYWQVVDSASGWGFLLNPLTTNSSGGFTTNYTVNEKFYAIGQFSEFIRPGCEIISVSDSYTLAAWTPSNSTLVLVMINTNTSSLNVTYSLGSFLPVPWQVAVTQTAPGENMVSKPPLLVVNNQFTSAIPALSITTFVLTTNATAPTVLSQIPVPTTNSMTLFSGETPTFSVLAAGSPPLYYEWLLNGAAVQATTNASFTPTAAQLVNVTNIVCVVSNSAGAATNTPWTTAIVSAPAAAYPRAVLALNPIGYWRLNETPDNDSGNNGAVCHDYVGGNNGVYSNVVLAQSGYSQLVEPAETSTLFGSVLTTNSAASRINCQDFALYAGYNAEFSITAWINGAGYTQKLNAGIACKGYNYGEELDLDEGAPGNCLRFAVRDAAGTAYSASSTINAQTNAGWHHLVGVCDEVNSNLLLYVDGVLAGSAVIPAKSGITNSSTVPLSIGARAASATSGYNQQFAGWINDVALFNHALTANQVQTLYQSGASLPPVSLTLTNLDGVHLQCNWNYGTLQCATNLDGPFQDLTNMVQPCAITISNAPQLFYRVRQN